MFNVTFSVSIKTFFIKQKYDVINKYVDEMPAECLIYFMLFPIILCEFSVVDLKALNISRNVVTASNDSNLFIVDFYRKIFARLKYIG